jgi:hypothetical protein
MEYRYFHDTNATPLSRNYICEEILPPSVCVAQYDFEKKL